MQCVCDSPRDVMYLGVHYHLCHVRSLQILAFYTFSGENYVILQFVIYVDVYKFVIELLVVF